METWAKLFVDEKRGQVLVTSDWDNDEDKDVVRLEFRGRAAVTISLHFDDEAKRDAAFEAITQDNVSKVIADGSVVLGVIGG